MDLLNGHSSLSRQKPVSSETHHFNRYWVIDCLRGIAVLLMMGFHLAYDVFVFGEKNIQNLISIPLWFWLYMPKLIGGLFFSMLGISAWFKMDALGTKSYRPFFKRGIQLFGMALGITVVTALISSKVTIYFGALHGLGVSLLLIYPFFKYHYRNLFLGGALILLGVVLSQYRFDQSAFLWLGFVPKNGTGADYFPLIPWFGMVLVGVFIGQILSTKVHLLELGTQIKTLLPIRGMIWMGRKSLLIYLLHQPLMLILLRLSGIIQFNPS